MSPIPGSPLPLSQERLGFALALRAAPLGLAIGGASLAFALGFADAKLRTEMARAPVLSHELRYVPVTGFIENHELRDKGRARLTLRVSRSAICRQPIDRTACASRFPPRVTSSTRRGLRVAINHRIRAALPGETGEIAVALITGEQGGISQETKQTMRDSGLAHILSISGLHMVIMAGTVFWLRAGAARIMASASAQLPHQEMGGRRSARRLDLLSRSVGRRRSDRPLLDHDEHRARRR